MRQVARECWRVLRDDGVMFWNIADSMYSQTKGTGGPTPKQTSNAGSFYEPIHFDIPGLKPKDKCGIPERTALAFQADGWWWRSGITWVKPNPMPESVTDRPTKSTEMVYLFTKSERYAWDAEAVREDSLSPESYEPRTPRNPDKRLGDKLFQTKVGDHANGKVYPTRNLRDAWTIATQSYPGAHYATFPSELPRRCIKAGTSEKGACPKCGKGWVRVVSERNIPYDDTRVPGSHKPTSATKLSGPKMQAWLDANPIATLGWRPACACDAGDPVPCIVLDPFSGAATTGLVARELGRHYIGLELSGEYLQQSRDRLGLTALDAWAGGNGRKHEPASITDLPLFGGQHES
jgi:DNA modification methylase